MNEQADWIERKRLAEAHRVAAEAALHNPWHTQDERQQRAEWYLGQARLIEGEVGA